MKLLRKLRQVFRRNSATDNPSVSISWSSDGGNTWSSETHRKFGDEDLPISNSINLERGYLIFKPPR